MDSTNSLPVFEPEAEPKWRQRYYIKLSGFFNNTFLGIFVGIITAAVVNILTGEKSLGWRFELAILGYFGVIYSVYQLMIFRRELDDVESTRRSSVAAFEKRWKLSCGWENDKIVSRFFRFFSLAILLLFLAVFMNGWSNQIEATEASQQNISLLNSLDSLIKERVSGRFDRLNTKIDSIAYTQIATIKKLDSIKGKSGKTTKKYRSFKAPRNN
ncbi:hypothetical protein [Mucilaginibacter ginsenosidivorans]|uniref:Uncharacterized protein n=1 Tax=Mucilaginibacter ginsenosidivorans TaxID=398053 RepID=A0A5B8UVQ0_9SPHI|nr:hypothetical protein [Mucilaginibacter ginsenosidivorans]QEC62516.1 hypothetical protein FRZ54_07915 [Mucilaginibacter ginsenosidivorans]